jgi:hypothetical protein
VARLTTYLDLKSLEIQRSGFDFKLNHISNWQFSKSRYLARYVSHHNAMAYMTLAPTNEAVRGKHHAKKTFIRKKITVTIREVMKDERIVLLSKTRKNLQEWEKEY